MAVSILLSHSGGLYTSYIMSTLSREKQMLVNGKIKSLLHHVGKYCPAHQARHIGDVHRLGGLGVRGLFFAFRRKRQELRMYGSV